MRLVKSLLVLWIMISLAWVFSLPQTSLSEFYKTGNVRFIQELVLDDDSMPGDLFFERPFAVVCDQDNNVYIVDSDANNIKKFDSDGKFLQIIGRKGQGPGEFNGPHYMTFSLNRLVVWDLSNRRLCVFSPDGEFVKSCVISYDEGRVRKLRSLPNGEILVEKEKSFRRDSDKPQTCTIELYSQDLEYIRTVYKRDLWRRKYIRTQEFGITSLYFPFAPDVGWDVSPEGQIIVGYSDKYELEVYDREGRKISTISHIHEPVKVTDKDKKDYFSGLEFYRMGERLEEIPEYITKYTEFPKDMPVFDSILVDSEGNILVNVNTTNGVEKGKSFDAFDSDGHFISSVKIEGEGSFPLSRQTCIQNGSFWTLETGENELYHAVKYRISD